MNKPRRYDFDIDAYVARCQEGPCFVCGIVGRQPEYLDHHVLYEDDDHIVFLTRNPTMLGYTLVCPKRHVEDLARDMDSREYLAVQAVVHRAAQALSAVLPTERVYVMSLGSRTGNSHIHWHVAALPPGVPYRQQQFHALMIETAGVLDLDLGETAELAERIRVAMARPGSPEL